jgi:hypothetical protein
LGNFHFLTSKRICQEREEQDGEMFEGDGVILASGFNGGGGGCGNA